MENTRNEGGSPPDTDAADPDMYSYQDDVAQEDPLKERKFTHVVEAIVGSIATPAEVQAGKGEMGKAKGQAVYFMPPTASGLGTFVGMKAVSMTFHNDTDQKLVVNGAWTKNWSEEADVVDQIEPFSLELKPGASKTTAAKKQWNFVFCPANGESVPARLLMMRYYVHASDAWSEKYKATSLTVTEGTPTLTEEMKKVTAYRRVTNISYYTIGGVVDDETPTDLVGYGKFQDLSEIGNVDGSKPTPPEPYEGASLSGRTGQTRKRVSTFGMPSRPVRSDETNPAYQDVVVNLSTTDKIGLGVFPMDYYDDEYGWAGMLMLVTVSKKEVDEDSVPSPWKNTYTVPDVSGNSTLEWEIPVLGSLTLDEVNDDTAIVGGRYRYFEPAGAYVLWDCMRGKPALVGSGYGSYEGSYKFYGPKVFTGKKTVLRAVLPGAFKTRSVAAISWVGVFSVVCKIIEVLYLLGKAAGVYEERDRVMQPLLDPKAYTERNQAIAAEAHERLRKFAQYQRSIAPRALCTRRRDF